MDRLAAPLALLGRLLIAPLFLWDVVFLLASPRTSIGYIAKGGLPLPEIAFAATVALELAGGLAILAGFLTRWAALGLALFCLATAALFHTNWADLDTKIHFLKNLAMAGGLLQLAAWGGGAWSLDVRLRRR